MKNDISNKLELDKLNAARVESKPEYVCQCYLCGKTVAKDECIGLDGPEGAKMCGGCYADFLKSWLAHLSLDTDQT